VTAASSSRHEHLPVHVFVHWHVVDAIANVVIPIESNIHQSKQLAEHRAIEKYWQQLEPSQPQSDQLP
jgi:hypothetical protein